MRQKGKLGVGGLVSLMRAAAASLGCVPLCAAAVRLRSR